MRSPSTSLRDFRKQVYATPLAELNPAGGKKDAKLARRLKDELVSELLPRLRSLVLLAKQYNIGLNIDAEEADRLEISLDMMEVLAFDPALAGYDGITLDAIFRDEAAREILQRQLADRGKEILQQVLQNDTGGSSAFGWGQSQSQFGESSQGQSGSTGQATWPPAMATGR